MMGYAHVARSLWLLIWGSRPSTTPKPDPRTERRYGELINKLFESKVESVINSRPFIPLHKLDTLLNEGAIKSELLAAEVKCATNAALIQYILKHAKKIFATLVMIGRPHLIKELSVSGLTDADLPLGIESRVVRSYESTSDDLNMETKWLVFKTWPLHLIAIFCEFQWRVPAPEIVENEFGRFFHKNCPLLFIPPPSGNEDAIFSHHSKVCKAEIHPAYLIPVDGRWGLEVAIKELHPSGVEESQPEATSLAKLRNLNHPHLIKSIATYRQSGIYCSLFPWANGGNLHQIWASEDALPRTGDLITWAVRQMAGIANGVVALHNFSLHENCRHGDLKPQNILRFLGATRDSFGTLVVSDLGSATFHFESTENRVRQTTQAGYGTVRADSAELGELLSEILDKVKERPDYAFEWLNWEEAENTGLPPPLNTAEQGLGQERYRSLGEDLPRSVGYISPGPAA